MIRREPRAAPRDAAGPSFEGEFRALFAVHFDRVFRVLNRIAGDADLAADLTQDAFVRLLERGSMPGEPASWLITVALNLFRNSRTTESRRRQLLTVERGGRAHSDPSPAPDRATESRETQRRVRAVLDSLPERERNMLLLRAEGYTYRDIAVALDVHEASVGTLLSRAVQSFRGGFHDDDAP
ncbi:MAG: RNA polymerase sigma factor [Gemmatimonadaceae bacterium]